MNRWEFWIDVGGTFTDCLAHSPDGRLLTSKVLSSAVTKGTIERRPDAATIVDAARRPDPADFWSGYEIRFVDAAGTVAHSTRVTSFQKDAGLLTLEDAPPARVDAGFRYEL
ncbi:MAG TPA: hydantoinase/oxoprolinase N-terminal domain-containing protein, partial [Planctomycetaceae bacterium]|nr:hydantoinase/oxoprolinase N-terminal domain-containing protein [Planctomycetaceae bacterium]